jgi:ATP-dependent helicase/nuclease subunit A
MTARNEATERQVRAAQPDVSTWLAANAGSGKTRVLTDRVARLLLAEVQPQHILCLTYTKAAASEMQNRLFLRLGEWAMLPDTALRAELAELGLERGLDAVRLGHARTLFARAIEAPGGLKIQTIHSFCASLLRRFPLEAGVSPQFTEMEERAAAMLRAEIVDSLADGVGAVAVAGIARHFTSENLDKLTDEIVRHRDLFEVDRSFQDVLSVFDLPAHTTEETVLRSVFVGGERDILDALIGPLLGSGTNDVKAGNRLASLARLDMDALPVLESVFLTGEGAKSPFSAKLGSFPTKALQEELTKTMPALNAWMERVEAARETRLAFVAARKTFALHQFARQFLPAYEAHKQQRGWLDFDDLILKSRQLLSDASVAQWVLYRLDGGIDHILVDEAQDTSPAQWDVIERLAREFTSGQGARADTPRTIFVVGDKKQSIYSFQGADPREFDRMEAEFKARLDAVGQPLIDSTLEFSFRSSDAILRLVDMTFAPHQTAGFNKEALHRAFKTELPGRVDLWPVVEAVKDDDERVWFDPVDRRSPRHHNVILAQQIARTIRAMIEGGETVPVDGDEGGPFQKRAVQPGDFLILVQRRSDLFQEIIRACKGEGLPIAGADRLKVGAETAVKDLGALLSFLATPEDNLSLASVLKSPLCGWSEKDLFDLAHRRTEPLLWQALRTRHDIYPDTLKMLDDLRNKVDFLRPFDLIERILTRHNGRKNLLARLGSEAEDGINALLSQALAYESTSVPSLTGFLIWMETDDLDVKRQMDNAGNRIRVMTVHGAKGLEAPIVILPDTASRRLPQMDQILVAKDQAVWGMPVAAAPSTIIAANAARKGAETDERLRLLYVAMTRAEKWLIVAAAGDPCKDESSWYQLIANGMAEAGALPHAFENGQGLRLTHADWSALEPVSAQVSPEAPPVVPAFFDDPAPVVAQPEKTLSPSDLGGAKALPGDIGLDEDQALRRGRQIHILLERLASIDPAAHPQAAERLLSQGPDRATQAELAGLLGEVGAVFANPALAYMFAPSTLAEVSVTADFGRRRLHGAIDRLIVSDDTVLAVDFKSNALVPDAAEDTPEGILRQMGAYAHALSMIYPQRRIETAILWTKTATLMRLPHDLVTNARGRIPYLDDGPRAT